MPIRVGTVVDRVDGVEAAQARRGRQDVDRRVTEVLADDLEELARLDHGYLRARRSKRRRLVDVLGDGGLVHLPAVGSRERAGRDHE
jgi:hypothetical protein